MKHWLITDEHYSVWIPVLVFRPDGRPCLCYTPHDEDCTCSVPPVLSDPS